MTTDPHADLRAMLEALPDGIQWQPDGLGRLVLRYGPTGFSDDQMKVVVNWILGGPTLVRVLLAGRDALNAEVERSHAIIDRLKATVVDTLNQRDATSRSLREENAALKAEVEKLRAVKPAEDADAAWRERLLAFEEEKMRCKLATKVALTGDWRQDAIHGHNYADALIAEARRRKEAGK